MASGDVVNLEAWSRGLLGDAQLENVASLAAWCQRTSAAAQDDGDDEEAHTASSSTSPSNTQQASSSSAIALPSAPITSSSALLPWLESIKSSTAPTTASSSSSLSLAPLAQIDEAARRTTALLSQLESARINVAELKAGSRSIEETSEELRTESESGGRGGAHGSRSLARLVDEIDAQLSYYTVLPQATTFLSSPKIVPVVLSQRFATTLAQCDVGYSFVKARPHYRDAAIYRLRFEHCLTRGGTLARMWIVSRFKEVGSEMSNELKERNKVAAAEKEDQSQHALLDFALPKLLSILYRNSLSAAPEVRSTLVEITKRCTRGQNGRKATDDDADEAAAAAEPLDEDSMLQDYRAESVDDEDEGDDQYRPNTFAEFDTLLTDCQNAYFDSRRGALLPLITAALARIEGRAAAAAAAAAAASSSNESPLVIFLDQALQLLTPILASEYLLYAQFFDVDDGSHASATSTPLVDFLTSLCKDLADRLHPRIYAESRLGELARLAGCVLEASTASKDEGDRTAPCLFSLRDPINFTQHPLPHRERLPPGQDSETASHTWLRLPLIRPLYNDIAARLTFRARAVLQGRDIAGHQMTDEELLASIAALKERGGLTGKGKGSINANRRKARESLGVGVLQAAAQRALEEHEREQELGGSNESGGSAQQQQQQPRIALFSVPSAKTLATWHPSVSRSLRILSMLHPVLTRSQLAEVGIEAVEAARAGLARQPAVAAVMSSKKEAAAAASRIDVALWKLRQALLLREVSASVDLSLAQPSKADEVLLLQQRRRAASMRGASQAQPPAPPSLDVGAVTKVVAGLLDAVRRGFGGATTAQQPQTQASGAVGGALAQDVATSTRVVLDEVLATHQKEAKPADLEEELCNVQRLVACFVEDDEQVVESVMRGVVREMMAAGQDEARREALRVAAERVGVAMGEAAEA